MSAANQITDQQRRRLLTGHFSLSQREMIRHWFLSEEDIKDINGRRREYNRVGYAVQLCLLRYPGWPLKIDEPAPPNLLNYVGQQLGADKAEFFDYAKRDNTRQEHQQFIIKEYRFRQYGPACSADLRRHLEIEALSTDAPFTLVEFTTEWLRERKVILPALATLESLVRSVRSQVERDVYRRLFGRLAESHKAALNKLLEMGPSRGSLLGWLRRVPQSCSVAGILDLMHRLSWVRDAAFPHDLANGIAAHRIDRLAARGSRHSLSHFRRFPPEKRYSILACFLLNAAEELTDQSIDFHRRLIARMFRESEKKRWVGFVQQGPTVNEKLQNYSRLTAIIARAHKEGRNLESAIEKEFGWDVLQQDGEESGKLARPLNGSDFQDFRAQFPHFRQYTPLLIETFQFDGIPTQRSLLRAVETLRQMNRDERTGVPADAPRSFIKANWMPFVFTESGIDRCYYELCALAELCLGLKSGDIWVQGSRRYRKFDTYLIEPSIWAQRKETLLARAEPSLDCENYLNRRKELLDQELKKVAELTQQHLLPDARMDGSQLVISPLTRTGPDQTERWAEKVYALLPRIHLTQLLEEVDGWTHFSKAFTHLYTGQPAPDRTGLLTAVLADATNLGKTRMAHATEKYTADRLAWIEDWYIREPNYARALAAIVKLQGGIPLASRWGGGRRSSSDGQAFPIAFRKPVIAQVNAKYGREPVATFYTHVSDQYAPFHVRAISSTVRDATHVLDGLLNHPNALQIEEHYTDTSGYTDHIFAFCHLLGFRFAPRIRDLSDHRIFSFEKPVQYDSIKSLLGGRIHERTIRQDWDDVARLVTSVRQGTASPSLLVGKLAGHPRQNHLFLAMREIGRIERSLFTLEWLQNPELRRRVTIGLNKGEAHHTLKRAIRFYRRGSVNDRQLDQDLNAMALNLIVAAIILWNTAYLDRAVQLLKEEGIAFREEYLPHISPLGWEHITITGTYRWKGVNRPWGQFQPLRREAVEFLRANIA